MVILNDPAQSVPEKRNTMTWIDMQIISDIMIARENVAFHINISQIIKSLNILRIVIYEEINNYIENTAIYERK